MEIKMKLKFKKIDACARTSYSVQVGGEIEIMEIKGAGVEL